MEFIALDMDIGDKSQKFVGHVTGRKHWYMSRVSVALALGHKLVYKYSWII
jgi:hypothetical protein